MANDKVKIINELFCSILKIENCKNEDSFIELGGGSFEFTKLQMQLKKQLGKKISLKELYRNSSVNEIVALFEEDTKEMKEMVHQVTDMQKTVYVGRKNEVVLGGSASKAYFELECKEYDSQKFQETVDKIMVSQPSLRASYTEDGKCIIKNDVKNLVTEYDLRNYSEMEKQEKLEENRKKQYEVEFDVANPPLAAFAVSRLTDKEALIHITYDGLVSDGEGLDILINELDKVYGGCEPSIPCNFVDYYSFINEMKSSEDFEKDQAFWNEMVHNISHRPRIPIIRRPERVEKPSAVQIVREFSDEEYSSIESIARKNNLTVFSLLLTIFGKVLSLYSENHSFFINVPMSVRPEECRNIEKTLGLCSNFTFVHFDDTKNESIAETAIKTQETLFDCREHSNFLGTDILKLFQTKIGASIPAPITFTSTIGTGNNCNLKHFRKRYVRTYTSQNWIEALMTEMNGKKVFLMNYEPDLIPEVIAEGIADCFCETVQALNVDYNQVNLIRNINVSKNDYAVIKEKALLHNEDVNTSNSKIVGKAIQENLVKYADRKAIAWEDGVVTYDELKNQAESFLTVLIKECGKKPARIAVVMDKSPKQIVVSVACICAGISYMPLDTELPEESQIQCIENTKAEAVIVLGDYFDNLQSDCFKIIRAGDDLFTHKFEQSNFAGEIDSETEAVVINTSGTTGIPKSVSILNKGISNCIFNNESIMGMDYVPIALAVTSFCHDLSLYDIYGTIVAGGCVVVPSEAKKKEPSHWYELAMKYKVNFWNSVPAFLEMLILLGDTKSKEVIMQLKTIVMGGDWISINLAKKLMELSPDTNIFSVGGPTETTIWNIYHKIDESDTERDFIPYGKPFPETSYYNLNTQGALCPIGVPGVMYVSGTGVSAGYIGNEDETAFRYLEYNGERVYNTGDKGLYLENGELRILGRDDYQIKINGKRIELTGIENAVKSYDPISACVVFVDKTNEKLVAAYIADEEIDDSDLKRSLSNVLQPYMIPHKLIRVESFPVTGNGKINRKKVAEMLDEPAVVSFARTDDKKADNSDVLSQIVDACKEIFEDEDITAEDDFYGIGGDSIAAMKLAAWVKENYGVEIQVFDILNNPDLSEIAKLVEGCDEFE